MFSRKRRKKKKWFFTYRWKKILRTFNRAKKKKKKIRKRERNTIFTKIIAFIYNQQKAIIIVTAGVFVVILGVVVFKQTIFSPRYTIWTVTITASSQEQYNNAVMYDKVESLITNKNYFLFNWRSKNEVIEELQTWYPFIEDIQLELIDDGSVLTTVTFDDPTIIFLMPEERRYWTYNEKLYSLGTGDFLGTESPVIQLPRYTQDLESIHWIFYRISEQRLLDVYTTVISTLWENNINEIIYLPWWQKFFLWYKGKRLYLNINKDVNRQLAKLVDLENYYEWFDTLSRIDLWSLDDIIVR